MILQSCLIFLDLKKAFDTVHYRILLDKLDRYGINGLEHRWFNSYLENRQQFYKVNASISSVGNIEVEGTSGILLKSPSISFIYPYLAICMEERQRKLYMWMIQRLHTHQRSRGTSTFVVYEELVCMGKWLHGNKLSISAIITQAMDYCFLIGAW